MPLEHPVAIITGAGAIFIHADVSVEEECRHFARAATDAFGRIDVLVANAGVHVGQDPIASNESFNDIHSISQIIMGSLQCIIETLKEEGKESFPSNRIEW